MSVWLTKSLDRDVEYIVVKHYLPGINGKIYGVTFRSSYGVVEKGSKTHRSLMRMPIFKNAAEKPLIFLKNLPFITRTSDIERVYGKEVYTKFLAAVKEEQRQAELAKQAMEEAVQQERKDILTKKIELVKELKEAQNEEDFEKVEEIKSTMPQITKCSYVVPTTNKLCKFDAFDLSPSGYCKMHIFQDTRLSEFGVEVPTGMSKIERKKYRKVLYKKLKKAIKPGDIDG